MGDREVEREKEREYLRKRVKGSARETALESECCKGRSEIVSVCKRL